LLTGCGGHSGSGDEPPRSTRAATVATVGQCLAAAGARPARGADDLRFARKAKAGQVGIALDGRTTYEFLPAAGGRVYRTRRSDAPPPRGAAAPLAAGEQVAILAPRAGAQAQRRAAGCADGAPE